MAHDLTTISYRRIWQLAWPASIASLITPLLGLTDAVVLGYSPRPFDVGAVGLAGAVFSLIYWTFGFLRMSTAGLTAQAAGAGDERRARRALAHGAGLGAVIGLVILAVQIPYGELAFAIMSGSAEVEAATVSAARDYYGIRIWGAPLVLMTTALFGWFTGRGHTGYLMAVVAVMTFLNMGLDAWFVLGLGLGAKGVAWGTLISELAGGALAIAGGLRLLGKYGGVRSFWAQIDYLAVKPLMRLFAVNFDIFIRTLVLVAAFSWFVRAGAAFGDVVLSANQILLQLFLFTGLALDGGAIAGEALTGQSLGAARRDARETLFRQTVIRSSQMTAVAAIAMTVIYFLFREPLLALVAPEPTIRVAAGEYYLWVALSPVIVAACFQLDGYYIGATRSRALRNSMLVSGLAYFLAIRLLTPPLANHGLWLAMGTFMLARAVTLIFAFPGFRRLTETGLTGD